MRERREGARDRLEVRRVVHIAVPASTGFGAGRRGAAAGRTLDGMDLPPLAFRSALLDNGWTDPELRRKLRSGSITPVRRGSYRTGTEPDTPEARHALLVRATVPHLAPGWVVSDVSAAVLLGLPVWNLPLDRVHVTRDGTGGGRVTRGVHRHLAPLDPSEIVRVDGIRVTSPARTVVDTASRAPFEQAVVVADAALAPRPGGPLTDRVALTAAVDRSARHGRAAARRAVAFADGGGRSPGESRSRVAMWRAGLPAPVLQYEVRTADGRLVGTVDFGWPELHTVGEFDGRIKYGGRLLRPGQDAADAVYEEKLREDGIRAEDLAMTRWTWPDIDPFTAVADRLRGRFRGPAHLLVVRAWPDIRG